MHVSFRSLVSPARLGSESRLQPRSTSSSRFVSFGRNSQELKPSSVRRCKFTSSASDGSGHLYGLSSISSRSVKRAETLPISVSSSQFSIESRSKCSNASIPPRLINCPSLSPSPFSCGILCRNSSDLRLSDSIDNSSSFAAVESTEKSLIPSALVSVSDRSCFKAASASTSSNSAADKESVSTFEKISIPSSCSIDPLTVSARIADGFSSAAASSSNESKYAVTASSGTDFKLQPESRLFVSSRFNPVNLYRFS